MYLHYWFRNLIIWSASSYSIGFITSKMAVITLLAIIMLSVATVYQFLERLLGILKSWKVDQGQTIPQPSWNSVERLSRPGLLPTLYSVPVLSHDEGLGFFYHAVVHTLTTVCGVHLHHLLDRFCGRPCSGWALFQYKLPSIPCIQESSTLKKAGFCVPCEGSIYQDTKTHSAPLSCTAFEPWVLLTKMCLLDLTEDKPNLWLEMPHTSLVCYSSEWKNGGMLDVSNALCGDATQAKCPNPSRSNIPTCNLKPWNASFPLTELLKTRWKCVRFFNVKARLDYKDAISLYSHREFHLYRSNPVCQKEKKKKKNIPPQSWLQDERIHPVSHNPSWCHYGDMMHAWDMVRAFLAVTVWALCVCVYFYWNLHTNTLVFAVYESRIQQPLCVCVWCVNTLCVCFFVCICISV